MFHRLERAIFQAVSQHLNEPEITVSIEQPKQASFGELALPVAFQLARVRRKAPPVIAKELAEGLAGKIEGVKALEVAGGYLNVRFERGWFARQVLTGKGAGEEQADGKIIVEHTNINPNKAAHIGHLRNSILGDSFVRMMRAQGSRVEVQNYIDNTGVQVADVVAGFHFVEGKTAAEVGEVAAQPRFDYYCWDLYSKVAQRPEIKEWRAARGAGGSGACGGRCDCGMPPEYDAAAGDRIRCAAARERDSAPEVLGELL